MTSRMRCIASCLAVLVPLTAGAGRVDAEITLNAIDRGWYLQDGSHNAPNDNYAVGRRIGEQFHNFAVFDFTGLSMPIASAQLQLFNPPSSVASGFSSFKPFEIYTLFDVSTPIADLRASHTGRTDIFADLGSGVPYGSQVVSAANDNSFVTVDLNAAGLAALNAAAGGQFAIGGAITSLEPTSNADEFVFGFTSGNFGDVRLVVTPVPEPMSALLLGLGLVGLLGYGLRRRGRAVA